ncbi:DUF397 domain-containing protein [Phytomonospora endophytica]|uniref:Uncharacterized protein n=1 Tax=Phytomonospora endophytica TaxID=714109 RepID=A0A841G1D9_9ACTN|nr:DUF397 domain-containing protein [Phytomonospora endophytica]MBB6039572.1 hypothetical protein [Phytomonospora endophytica]
MVRDSKNCTGDDYPVLTTDAATWRGLTHQCAVGDFDR